MCRDIGTNTAAAIVATAYFAFCAVFFVAMHGGCTLDDTPQPHDVVSGNTTAGGCDTTYTVTPDSRSLYRQVVCGGEVIDTSMVVAILNGGHLEWVESSVGPDIITTPAAEFRAAAKALAAADTTGVTLAGILNELGLPVATFDHQRDRWTWPALACEADSARPPAVRWRYHYEIEGYVNQREVVVVVPPGVTGTRMLVQGFDVDGNASTWSETVEGDVLADSAMVVGECR